MRQTPLESKLYDLFTPPVENLGYRLVRVRVIGSGKNSQTVEVMVDSDVPGGVNLDQCAKVSRDLSALMDVEDPVQGRYRLEVSSPGIDRPLTRIEDFATYQECKAKVELDPPMEGGQKRFSGIIENVEGSEITLDTDKGRITFDFDRVQKAKLVLTDELIEATKAALEAKREEKEKETVQ